MYVYSVCVHMSVCVHESVCVCFDNGIILLNAQFSLVFSTAVDSVTTVST